MQPGYDVPGVHVDGSWIAVRQCMGGFVTILFPAPLDVAGRCLDIGIVSNWLVMRSRDLLGFCLVGGREEQGCDWPECSVGGSGVWMGVCIHFSDLCVCVYYPALL